ncbi:hypothetical protein COB55_03150 [Candidatus Wolfebacteria bacterium]|nr:MAG: hypothetical protein COB55_03150 [Candidatus Wolfebacteria bacterium]
MRCDFCDVEIDWSHIYNGYELCESCHRKQAHNEEKTNWIEMKWENVPIIRQPSREKGPEFVDTEFLFKYPSGECFMGTFFGTGDSTEILTMENLELSLYDHSFEFAKDFTHFLDPRKIK